MSAPNHYRVAIIGTGRMGGLIEDEIPVGSWSKPYGHFPAYAAIPETMAASTLRVSTPTATVTAAAVIRAGSGWPWVAAGQTTSGATMAGSTPTAV